MLSWGYFHFEIMLAGADQAFCSCPWGADALTNFVDEYSCLRCGHSGDAKDANYRYRLSLEVAEAHDVFDVTVFGSCLDAYFGVTAKGLQRYIEERNQEAGEPDRAASFGAVAEAVETCFIGKKFVFGVKDSVKHKDASSLQNDCQAGRRPRALTACQMFVPNPGLLGCTVIQYLQQHQGAPFGHSPAGFGPPGSLFVALDQPSLDHSYLQGPGLSGAAPSGGIDGLSSLWPQSFGLTSSSTSEGTAEDPVARRPSQTAYEKQKWEAHLVPSYSLSSQSSQSHDLAGINQNVQQDKPAPPFLTWCENVPARRESESQSSLRRKECCSLGSLLECEEKGPPCKISLRHSCGPEKSWSSLPCQKQGSSFGPLVASSSHIGARGNSPEAPWFGDELPSSESLNEFIAKLESSKAAESPPGAKAWECCPRKGPHEFHGHLNQSSPKPAVFRGNFLTGQPGEKLQKPAEEVEVWEEGRLPCRLNLSSLGGNESQQEASHSFLSLTGKEGWEYLPNENSVLFPWPSPSGSPPPSKGRCWSSKQGVDQEASSSKDLQACSSATSIRNCLGSPCLQTTLFRCKRGSSLANQRHIGNSSCQLRQTTDLADAQKEGFASASHEKSGAIHARSGEPLPEVPGHDYSGRHPSSLLQSYSDGPQGSYDASADLFDSSARGVGVALGALEAGQAVSEQEGALTEKPLGAELLPSELDARWNTSPCGLSSHATSDQKTSTPLAGSGAESEGSLAGTSDFVPYSQSTPFAKPLPRGRESILGDLPLNKLSWINARCRRPRPGLKLSSRRRCFGKFLWPRRVSNACWTAGDVEDQVQFLTNGSPAQKLFENDSEEWIPPSETKVFRWRRRVLARNFAAYQIVGEKSLLSKNGAGCETVSTPKKQQPVEAPIGTRLVHEDTANPGHQTDASPASCALAKVTWLNQVSDSVPNAVSWSPELFADSSPPPSTEPVLSDPSLLNFSVFLNYDL